MFPTHEAFHKAYTEEYGRARAYKEIFAILENAGVMAQNIAQQINNPKKDYSLGTKDDEAKPTTNRS